MSLLLEALKKAALEKRNRADAATDVPAVGQQETPAGDSPELPAVSKAAADYLAHQAPQHRPVVDPDAGAQSDPELVPESVPESVENSQPLADFSLNPESLAEAGAETAVEPEPEPEPEPQPEPQPEPEPEPESQPEPEPAASDFLADLSYSEQIPAEEPAPAVEDLDLDLNQAIVDQHLSVEDLSDAEDLLADREALARAESDNRKVALTKLMDNSRQVARESRRRGAILYTLLTLTASGAIGLYYYYLSSSEEAERAPIIASDMLAPAPDTEAPAESSAVDEAAVNETTVAQADVAVTVPGAAQDSGDAMVADAQMTTAAPAAADSITATLTASAQPAPARAQVDSGIRAALAGGETSSPQVILERREVPRPANRAIRAGYEAYRRGDLDAAELAYADALALAPRQRDALLGAAGVAVQKGQFQQALRLYQRRLADDPNDAYAQAGLLALAGQGPTDPELRSEVKLLLQDHPQEAHLHFLLGSLQAAAGEWRDAQQAFFEARSWDKANADYAYNLAVALDHIDQPAQALRQYQDALGLAQLGRANFDREVVRNRVQQLGTAAQ
ncbi:MAG: tetratricopeptide repeat protein [Halieaceae bacterium]